MSNYKIYYWNTIYKIYYWNTIDTLDIIKPWRKREKKKLRCCYWWTRTPFLVFHTGPRQFTVYFKYCWVYTMFRILLGYTSTFFPILSFRLVDSTYYSLSTINNRSKVWLLYLPILGLIKPLVMNSSTRDVLQTSGESIDNTTYQVIRDLDDRTLLQN